MGIHFGLECRNGQSVKDCVLVSSVTYTLNPVMSDKYSHKFTVACFLWSERVLELHLYHLKHEILNNSQKTVFFFDNIEPIDKIKKKMQIFVSYLLCHAFMANIVWYSEYGVKTAQFYSETQAEQKYAFWCRCWYLYDEVLMLVM